MSRKRLSFTVANNGFKGWPELAFRNNAERIHTNEAGTLFPGIRTKLSKRIG